MTDQEYRESVVRDARRLGNAMGALNIALQYLQGEPPWSHEVVVGAIERALKYDGSAR
jgi:hypothetical protein